MKSAVAFAKKDSPKKSSITNCQLIVKHDEKANYLFEFPDVPEPGAGYVNLDSYLICPLEMFTPRQLNMARKKYAALSRT